MNETFDSIYPDFLRTGLGKLHSLGVGRDLLALFTALEHFRRDIHDQNDVTGILRATQQYIGGLNLFEAAAFYLVNSADFNFELVLCAPAEHRDQLDQLVKAEMRSGKFAWALRQTAPVLFATHDDSHGGRGLLHSLGIARQMVGMFCGLLKHERNPAQEITYHLLTMLLGTCADAIAAAQRTMALKNEITVLSGLLPICAWCKKIRDDKGYWKQLETYIETHSEAVFSHGMCPECLTKARESMRAKKS
jgi:hypothetical protein